MGDRECIGHRRRTIFWRAQMGRHQARAALPSRVSRAQLDNPRQTARQRASCPDHALKKLRKVHCCFGHRVSVWSVVEASKLDPNIHLGGRHPATLQEALEYTTASDNSAGPALFRKLTQLRRPPSLALPLKIVKKTFREKWPDNLGMRSLRPPRTFLNPNRPT